LSRTSLMNDLHEENQTGGSTSDRHGTAEMSTGDHDDEDEDEFLVHTTAPTNASFDKIYREQANQALSFVPARRIDVGSVSWPRKRAFWVNEEQYEALTTKMAKIVDDDGKSNSYSLRTQRQFSPRSSRKPRCKQH